MLQDGTEYWEENSLELAIASMIDFARFMNGAVITVNDICIYYLVPPAPGASSVMIINQKG